jgi:hypothetical protein
MTPEELRELRLRFLTDFRFYAKHSCKIRTKAGAIVPFVLNPVQDRFLKQVEDQIRLTGRVRMVVLKARQQGLSTFISAWQYWYLSQRQAKKGLVMAHEADSTSSLFDMYKRLHENCPELLRPSTKYSNRTELVFDVLDTGIRVATAGGRGVARGETLQTAHLSEVAFWPTAFAAQNFNGLIQAVPEVDDTAVYVESTANGMTGKFYELCDGARKGINGYELFFSAWFESAEYREKSPEDFTRTPEEDRLVELYQLDNDQLFWRRRKIAANGSELFKQEYPATPEEAFISTGRPVFNTDWVYERLQQSVSPIIRMAVEEGSVREHPQGELLVYREHDPAESYTIGADVGIGIRNGDYSCAQVLDSKLRQVSVWRGIVQPDYFATILQALGLFYNSALIAPERNNHGLLTCVRLGRDLMYPNTFTDVTEGALEDRESINIGHYTSERTKPLVIDKLREVIRAREIEIYDETTLREMLTYVVSESGRLTADHGCHDDTVMALAIANHVHEGRWEPVPVTPDFYTSAI